MMVDAKAKDGESHGLLSAIENILSTVFIPSLRNLEEGWGSLDNNGQVRMEFLNTLDSFVAAMVGAKESLDEKVTLTPCGTYDLSTIRGPHDYQSVANSSGSLQAIEECIQVWIKQIDQVCIF